MKKLFSAAVGVGMLLTAVTPAFAKVTVNIKDTGFLSSNNVLTNENRNLRVTNTNNALLTNRTISVSNSGLNLDILNNKVSGSGTTGKAVSQVTMENQLNGTVTAIQECNGCDDEISVSLDQTGPLSRNNVSVSTNKNISVTNNNNATVTNEVISVANSGLNVKFGNTADTNSGSSGDAKSEVAIGNYLNTSETYINAMVE